MKKGNISGILGLASLVVGLAFPTAGHAQITSNPSEPELLSIAELEPTSMAQSFTATNLPQAGAGMNIVIVIATMGMGALSGRHFALSNRLRRTAKNIDII